MRILQVVRQYLPSTGGMETYVSTLCRELLARGHEADVATLDYLFYQDRRLPSYERIENTDVIRLPSAGNPRYFLAPRLWQLLPRYDLIHIHGVDFFADFMGALKKIHGRPVVLSTHGGFFHTGWFPLFKKMYFHSVTRLALIGVDRVIASSPVDRQLFSQISGRVSLVENGIDFRRFAAVRKSMDGETLLFVGRISKNKRVDRLLEALARLRQDRPEARLEVVGPDWEGLQEKLRQQAEALGIGGAVTFRGALPPEEVLEELARARLFVSASEYEAFGISTVEAMAAGTVPVVNRIQACEDIIEDGETGYLTDFARTEQASGTLGRALELSDERLLKMGERARERASRYDWQNVAAEIVGIYEDVLGEKKAKTRHAQPTSKRHHDR